jgi:adenosylhomocysteine nucleosidase
VSGDQFIAGSDQATALVSAYGALCADMEAASIAQVAELNEVPFVCLRAMSDRADHAAHVHFGEFLRVATANYGLLLREFLRRL